LAYTQSITIKMIAKMKQTTASGTAHPPNAAFKPGSTKAKTPKAIKSKIANMNEMIGMNLGKKNVNAILINPQAMAIMNAHKIVLLNPE